MVNVRNNSAATDAFGKVMKVRNHTGMCNADIAS